MMLGRVLVEGVGSMRHAAYSDVATVQLEHNVEVLERKLIGLRAEIDAILSQLAVEKVAEPAVEWAPTPEPQAPEATVDAPEPAPAAPAQAEIETEPSLAGEGSSLPMDDMPMHAIALDQRSAEAAPQAPSSEILARDSPAPVDAFDQTPAVAESAETAAPQVEMQFNPAREAAMPIAPATSMEPGSPPPAPAEPSAAAAPQRADDGEPAPATVDAAAPAAAQVIGLQLRRPDTLAPTASRRRLATKIAASIIALLVAATMLVIADKQAVGSALTLPWMSSHLPAKASRSIDDRQGSGQDSLTDDRRDARSARAAADEALLLRYREAWSTGW
jgi:hypothetical protein